MKGRKFSLFHVLHAITLEAAYAAQLSYGVHMTRAAFADLQNWRRSFAWFRGVHPNDR